MTIPAPPRQPANPSAGATTLIRRRVLYGLTGVAALLVVGLVAFIGARLGQPPSSPPAPPATASATTTRPALPPPDPAQNYNQPAPTPSEPGQPPPPPVQGGGDLGLGQPISHPSCNGQGIVILGSVTTPGLYAAGVQRLLYEHPGAFYLRTDQTCPSLRRGQRRRRRRLRKVVEHHHRSRVHHPVLSTPAGRGNGTTPTRLSPCGIRP